MKGKNSTMENSSQVEDLKTAERKEEDNHLEETGTTEEKEMSVILSKAEVTGVITEIIETREITETRETTETEETTEETTEEMTEETTDATTVISETTDMTAGETIVPVNNRKSADQGQEPLNKKDKHQKKEER